MEMIVFIICLFLLFDISLLKRRALPIFESAFYFPRWETLTIIGLLMGVVLKAGQYGSEPLEILFAALLVIYLLRRRKFLSLIKISSDYAAVVDERLELALSTFSVMALWAAGMLLISIFAELVQRILHQPFDELAKLLIFSEISSVLLVILIYRAARVRKNLRLFDILGLETKGLGPLKIWVWPMAFAFLYAMGTYFILNTRPIQPTTPLQDLLNSTTSLGVILFFIGTAVLTAPFFEEIIFRGFFFYVIRPYKGVVFAVFFVALAFAILHVDQYWGDWEGIAVVGFFGLVLTVLRAWTGSSVPGMIAHYVYNTTLIIIPIFMVLGSNPIYLNYEIHSERMTNEQKEEQLLKSIAHYPQFSNAYNDLAWLYAQKGIKLDQALEFVDKALSLDPGTYAYLNTKAEVLFKMGRSDEAIGIERDLLKKYPKDTYLDKQIKKFQRQKPGEAVIFAIMPS